MDRRFVVVVFLFLNTMLIAQEHIKKANFKL